MVRADKAHQTAENDKDSVFGRIVRDTEIDSRMLGMVGALILIWIGFDVYSRFTIGGDGLFGGSFLTPRNLWVLLVQTSSIAVMSTGMVVIIVMRHIDLSVGSILGFTAVSLGIMQVFWLGPTLGVGHPAVWIVSLLLGLAIGAAIGAFQGSLVTYFGIPSFIVTLGGLIVWRAAAWWLVRGETIAPMDKNFKLIGGGISGTTPGAIGSTASWILGALLCVAIILSIYHSRSRRREFRFALKPLWAEFFLAALGCAIVLGATLLMNSYYWPDGVVERWASQNGITVPAEGLRIPFGYPIPVLIAAGVGILMTFITTRTRFGRYVYAIGGNPDAAELAGINTRKITILAFAIMGTLAAVSASISSARLDSATNALGQFDELYVIAAAVIGGTSLAGGIGTVYGAMLGALVMQSLQSGMTLLNFESATKDLVVGCVLVFAVWLDQAYRRRLV